MRGMGWLAGIVGVGVKKGDEEEGAVGVGRRGRREDVGG